MRRVGAVLLGIVSSAVLSSSARAHSRLTEPPSRSEDFDRMDGPCGAVAPGSERTTYEAGAVITMRWELIQNHFNRFRVAFSPADDEGFEDNVLGTRPDEADVFEYEQEVPMPMCTCDACTLQLQQLTETGKLAYYSCADIRLVAPEGEDVPVCAAGEGTTTGSDPDSDPGTGTGTGTGTEPEPEPEPEASSSSGSGCRLGGTGSFVGWLGLGLGGLFGRRRRPNNPLGRPGSEKSGSPPRRPLL